MSAKIKYHLCLSEGLRGPGEDQQWGPAVLCRQKLSRVNKRKPGKEMS